MNVTREIAGRTVIVECADALAHGATDVLAAIERVSAGGPALAGLRIRFGWSVLTLRERADGSLVVCEPNFDADPLRQVRPRLDVTLAVLARQTAFVARIGVIPVDVGFEQLLVCARGALGARRVRLSRASAPAAEDSGWYCAEASEERPSDDPGVFAAIRVFELLRTRPALLAALALAPDFSVVFDGDDVVAVWDRDGAERWRGAT